MKVYLPLFSLCLGTSSSTSPSLRGTNETSLGVAAPSDGPYKTAHKTVTVAGFTGGASNLMAVVYPSDGDGPFPLISFGHGMTAGGTAAYNDYSILLNHVASWGFVVTAYESCNPSCLDYGAHDQQWAIRTVKERVGTDPVFQMVDFTRGVGIFGHSMGGAATLMNTDDLTTIKELNITAAAALHPATDLFPFNQGMSNHLPTIFCTGSADTLVPPGFVKGAYNYDPTSPKIYANIKGATHLEPCNIGSQGHRWDPYVSRHFMCHLNDDSDACDLVYGKGFESFARAYTYSEFDYKA